MSLKNPKKLHKLAKCNPENPEFGSEIWLDTLLITSQNLDDPLLPLLPPPPILPPTTFTLTSGIE